MEIKIYNIKEMKWETKLILSNNVNVKMVLSGKEFEINEIEPSGLHIKKINSLDHGDQIYIKPDCSNVIVII